MQYIDVQHNIDTAPLSLFHYKVLFWCFLIIVIDGYDIAIAGAALPSIMADMGVTAATAGFMASSAMFGMMFGAISCGVLSEKIGRVKTIQYFTLYCWSRYRWCTSEYHRAND